MHIKDRRCHSAIWALSLVVSLPAVLAATGCPATRPTGSPSSSSGSTSRAAESVEPLRTATTEQAPDLDPATARRIFHAALGAPSEGRDHSPLLDMKKRGMSPLRSERLAEPVHLPSCAGVTIIEWRPTPGYAASTGPSAAATAIMNDTCSEALARFAAFLSAERIDLPLNPTPYDASLCLMPADRDRHGEEYRNLNDTSFRFVRRTREYDDDGELVPLWGYFEPSTNNIYIRNDVLQDDGSPSDRFVTVFAHELFHMMSRHHGVVGAHVGDRHIEEEAMAARFTEYLGHGH